MQSQSKGAFTVRGSQLVATVPDKELNETTVGTSFTHWMEDVLSNAMKRGALDDLPGKGKPLALRESDPYEGDDAAAYRMLKNAGFTPEWVELRRQIAFEIGWLKANPTSPMCPSRIVEVNILIDKHNRLIPNPSLAYPKVPRNFGRDPA